MDTKSTSQSHLFVIILSIHIQFLLLSACLKNICFANISKQTKRTSFVLCEFLYKKRRIENRAAQNEYSSTIQHLFHHSGAFHLQIQTRSSKSLGVKTSELR